MKVVVVSFGALEGARLWLQQTKCSLDFVLDPQRKVDYSLGWAVTIYFTHLFESLPFFFSIVVCCAKRDCNYC